MWCVVCGVCVCVCVCVYVSIHLFKMALRNAPARTFPYDRVLDGPTSGYMASLIAPCFKVLIKSVDGEIDHRRT